MSQRKKKTLCSNVSEHSTANSDSQGTKTPTKNNFNLMEKFQYKKKTPIKIECDKGSPEKMAGVWRPPNWEEFLKNLRIMRKNEDAPVDTMGCHKCPDTGVPPKVFRYQSLVSLMLSSQTKDQVTFAAMERLKARGLTVENVLDMSETELGELIKPVGFWRTKAKYIKKTTQMLKEQYDSDIPDSVEKMCKLVGVGPKMAHICMSVAWNTISGIGVDTHVHRICNRIGWVKSPTSTPEGTRKALESWLPSEEWKHVNHLLVGFGQTICTPVNPKCLECLNRHICPYKGKVRKSPLKSQNKNNYEIEDIFENKSPKKEIDVNDEIISSNSSLEEKYNNDVSHEIKTEPITNDQTINNIKTLEVPQLADLNEGKNVIKKLQTTKKTKDNKKFVKPLKQEPVDKNNENFVNVEESEQSETDTLDSDQDFEKSSTTKKIKNNKVSVPDKIKINKSPVKRKHSPGKESKSNEDNENIKTRKSPRIKKK